MGKDSFFDKARSIIAKVSFSIFLWSIQMTDDEYWRSVAEHEAAEQTRAVDQLRCEDCKREVDIQEVRCWECQETTAGN
jgi:cytochrome c-type biogenesis protein CcmH/NrfF